MSPALDSLLMLKFLSPVICLSQFRTRCGDLPLRIVATTDLSTLEIQWRKLLHVNWSFVCGGTIPKDSSQFWIAVLHYLDAVGAFPFRELAKWALTLLSLPISNAIVERSFSMMDVIKSKLRNRMLLPMLNSILVFRLWLSASSSCCSTFEPTKRMPPLNSDIYKACEVEVTDQTTDPVDPDHIPASLESQTSQGPMDQSAPLSLPFPSPVCPTPSREYEGPRTNPALTFPFEALLYFATSPGKRFLINVDRWSIVCIDEWQEACATNTSSAFRVVVSSSVIPRR